MKVYRFLCILFMVQMVLFSIMPVTSAAADQVVPSEPVGVGASNLNGAAHIWWQEPNQTGPGITQYHVYRMVNDTGPARIFQLNATVHEFNDRMPSSAATVTYRIVAENVIGLGNASEKITLVPGEHPSAPSGLKAVAGNDYVDISWTSPPSDGGSSITKYVVRRQIALTGESVQFDVKASGTSVPITSAHDEQATSGETYIYNVKAVTAQGESGFSDSLTVTSPPKNINDNSGILSVFAVIVSVIALQIAIIAFYVVMKRKEFKPKTPL
jgi:hypothetical protein